MTFLPKADLLTLEELDRLQHAPDFAVAATAQAVSDALEQRQPYSIDHRIVLPDGTTTQARGSHRARRCSPSSR